MTDSPRLEIRDGVSRNGALATLPSMTTQRLGRVQKLVLQSLASREHTATARDLAGDWCLSESSVRSALYALWRRKLVERAFSYSHLHWELTVLGAEVEEQLLPIEDS